MISTDHTSFAIKLFIEYMIVNGKKIYGEKLVQPKIIVMDFSLALIGGVIGAYNRQTLTDYLDQCYDYLRGKSGILPLTVVYVCAAHILNRVKYFLKKTSAANFNTIMALMGRFITYSDFNKIRVLCEISKVIFMSKTISKQIKVSTEKLKKFLNDVEVLNTKEERMDENISTEVMGESEELSDNHANDQEKEITSSKFHIYWRNVLNKIEIKEENTSESAKKNIFYNPDFFKNSQHGTCQPSPYGPKQLLVKI